MPLFTKERPTSAAATATPVVTASAQRVDLSDEKQATRLAKRHQAWQDEAWQYYHTVGEVWYAHNLIGNSLRRIRLYAAHQPDPAQPPIPVTEALEDDEGNVVAPAVPAAIAAAAEVEVDRLRRAEGGHGEIVRDLGLQLNVPGEGILVGRADPDIGEIWKVYSSSQVAKNDKGQTILRSSPSDREGIVLDANNSTTVRVWRPDPQWSGNPDSPMRAVLDLCDELQILSRTVRAAGRSRLAGAGILLVPSEATFGPAVPTETSTGGAATVDPFLRDLLNAMMEPIGDEGAASAVVPLVVRMGKDLIEAVTHLVFDRPIDQTAADQRVELIKRIAAGLDLPADVLLGMADLNHWTAWQVDESTFKAHIEPLVQMICNALTVGFLRPALGDAGADLMVWYDASALVSHPNRGEDAKAANVLGVISDAATRKYLGFPESDAPTDEELDAKAERAAKSRPAASPANAENVDAGPPEGQASVKRGGASALAAAGTPSNTGWRLAQIERDLRSRLQVAGDAAVFAGLERAGAKLRRKVGRDSELSDKLTRVPQHLVGFTLGRPTVERLGFADEAEEDLFQGVAEPLRERYNVWVSRAQAQVRQLAAEYDDVDDGMWRQRQDEDREAGWVLLAAGLVLATKDRLFNPAPDFPAVGEFDAVARVSPGLVRSSLSRAGGVSGQLTPGGAAVAEGEVQTGLTTGKTARDLFHSVGAVFSEMQWLYGDPGSRDRNYEPHEALDGVEFKNWTDEQLANDFDWPPEPYFFPGDHLYCQCDFAVVVTRQNEEEAA